MTKSNANSKLRKLVSSESLRRTLNKSFRFVIRRVMASGNPKVTDPAAPVQEASVTVTDKTGVNYEFQLMQVSDKSAMTIVRC